MSRPFNLEKAKAGAPLVDSAGDVHKFITHEPDASNKGTVLTFNLNTKGWYAFTETGNAAISLSRCLFLADPPKVKKEMFVAIGKDRNGKHWSICAKTELEAMFFHAEKNQEVVSLQKHVWEEEAP